MMKEITIDGDVYVKKGSPCDYHIVRCNNSGVFFGKIAKREGTEVLMQNARRLWYWSGAASLSQLAMEGVKNPPDCQFPCPVDEVLLLDAIEILSCTQAAYDSITAVPIWSA